MLPDTIVVHPPLGAGLRTLRAALAQSPHTTVAYAIPLDTPLVTRFLTMITLRWQVRRARRALSRSGARAVATYGVEPNIRHAAVLYELNSPASRYADRSLRRQGSAVVLRRIAMRCFGCDPALGAVLVVGRKS